MKGGIKVDIGDRIQLIRKSRGYTLAKFAEPLGVQKAAISKLENSQVSLTEQMANSICREYGVNKDWLLTGKGDMDVAKEPIPLDAELQQLVDKMLLSSPLDIKRRLITAMLKLDSVQIEKAICWIKETFDLVDAPAASDSREDAPAAYREDMPAASAKKKPSEEMTIDEKVASYRAELEAEEAAQMSGASPTGEGDEAVKDA